MQTGEHQAYIEKHHFLQSWLSLTIQNYLLQTQLDSPPQNPPILRYSKGTQNTSIYSKTGHHYI
jgi:hypothetical protein